MDYASVTSIIHSRLVVTYLFHGRLANYFKVARTLVPARSTGHACVWSQSSEIMGGYSTPDSMLEIGRLMSTMK